MHNHHILCLTTLLHAQLLYLRTLCCITDHDNTLLLKGKNGVKFYSFGPTIAKDSVPNVIEVGANDNGGKFSFTLKVADPDTHAKDIKITLATSDSK